MKIYLIEGPFILSLEYGGVFPEEEKYQVVKKAAVISIALSVKYKEGYHKKWNNLPPW